MSARVAAVRAVAAVVGAGRSLEVALAAEFAAGLEDHARPHAQALAYGALRYGHRLRSVASAMLPRPWDAQPAELKALLLVGLYQLEYSDTPAHAAVSTMVEAARRVGQAAAAGVVNACLRRFQREREALLAAVDQSRAGRFSHPGWLVSALERDQPQAVDTLLAANNAHPPLVLRANLCRIGTQELAARLTAAGHGVRPLAFAPSALELERPIDVRGLPEFVAGLCSVQDAAAQLAVPMLAAAPGMRVLDACAAPGGKACHLLEAVPGLAELVALELDPARAVRIAENLARLGLAATVVVGDALAPPAAAAGPFDRILVDAPCSGTGVIRRHPDIKWLRRPSDIAEMASRQRALLEALWPRLRPGGRLVYVTCSVLRAENDAVVADFLAGQPAAVDVSKSASLEWAGSLGLPPMAGPGIALLPGTAGTDGFYYACLERSAG